MAIPMVKEWGSWVVFICSVLAAYIAAKVSGAADAKEPALFQILLTVAGLFLLINAKNPLASFIHTRGKQRAHILWLLFFTLTGLACLLPFLAEGIGSFAVFALPALSYTILLAAGKEHHVLAELNGFALLTITAPVLYFVFTEELSLRLYLAVFLFFGAGVFKVRVRIRKTLFYRWVMACYVAFAAAAYSIAGISVLLLLPLLENVMSVILMREEKLRVTGYTELAKGVVFLTLLGLFWSGTP